MSSQEAGLATAATTLSAMPTQVRVCPHIESLHGIAEHLCAITPTSGDASMIHHLGVDVSYGWNPKKFV